MDTTLSMALFFCNTHQYRSSRRASYKRLKSHGGLFGLLGSYHTRIPTSIARAKITISGKQGEGWFVYCWKISNCDQPIRRLFFHQLIWDFSPTFFYNCFFHHQTDRRRNQLYIITIMITTATVAGVEAKITPWNLVTQQFLIRLFHIAVYTPAGLPSAPPQPSQTLSTTGREIKTFPINIL